MRRFVSLILLSTLFIATPAQSQGDLSVTLKTTPAASQIGPDKTLVHTTLSVVDGSGQPVPQAYLKLHLDAPPGNPLISTDFPIVENTSLLNYEGALPAGVLEFDYIYPIRGRYSFHVEAGRTPAELSFSDTLSLDLSENRNEIFNFLIFGLILLLVGLVAGLVIGNGARAGRLATAGVILVGLVAGLNSSSASVAQAHGGGEGAEVAPFTESATHDGLTLTYTMAPGAGRVGTLNTLNFTVTDNSGAFTPDTTFEVAFWHIEDDKPVLATHLYAPAGQARLDFQFFDGAEHEVRLTARNAAGEVDLSRVVEVEGLNPPLSVKLKTTFYLVMITFIGILIGLRLQIKVGGWSWELERRTSWELALGVGEGVHEFLATAGAAID